MNTATKIDDTLMNWDDLADTHQWCGLLIGNGFSRNIWNRFAYTSLFEQARSGGHSHSLSDDDVVLFDGLCTHNFEKVLSALSISTLVNRALKKEAQFLTERYSSIQNALIAAVHSIHCPWIGFTDDRKQRVVNALSEFETVYSTNYDLLIYWSIMTATDLFKDYFWSSDFDVTNTGTWGEATKILYLHGGLHLYRKSTGQTVKRSATGDRNLLDLFGQPFNGAVPLFISEGTADEKMSSIYNSDYLSFAMSRLTDDAEPLVVFGQALEPSDEHLIKAVRAHKDRPLAISIKPSAGPVNAQKARFAASFPGTDLYFFNSESHPLGGIDLQIAK